MDGITHATSSARWAWNGTDSCIYGGPGGNGPYQATPGIAHPRCVESSAVMLGGFGYLLTPPRIVDQLSDRSCEGRRAQLNDRSRVTGA